MRALKRNVHDVWCTCSFKSAGWLGRCASSLRRWPRVAHQPKQPSSSSWQHFLFASCVVCWSERPCKDDEQHCRSVVWEEKTVLQSLDVAFSAPSRKSSFLQVASFFPAKADVDWLCFKEILALVERESERFSPWQSENQKDSRLGRVRIIISDGTCALLNAQQIKMVSREACVCAMCSRTGQGLHVCMRAYLRNLLGNAAHCWPNPCCGTAFVQFFCSLFVNLLCRKPEIKSLGFTCNWLVLVGRLAWTSATCTYFRVADKFTTAKRKAGTLYHAKSFGIPNIRLVVA